MLTFLALAHMLHATQDTGLVGSVVYRRCLHVRKKVGFLTKCGAILMISCPSPSIISPKQPD